MAYHRTTEAVYFQGVTTTVVYGVGTKYIDNRQLVTKYVFRLFFRA